MANQENMTKESAGEQQGQSSIEQQPSASVPVQRSGSGTSPFSLMRRFNEDMDRLFGSFFSPSLLGWDDWSTAATDATFWPEIEVHQSGDKLIVQADIPGMKKEDVSVEVRNHQLTISGERRSESERNEGRYYRTERSYGTFRRTIALPEGAKDDSASATFENGVLKIEMDAPASGQTQGRKIEVRSGSPH
jgi:HSP20 family protein